jgi:TRAP transporter TAXI family solute receptor
MSIANSKRRFLKGFALAIVMALGLGPATLGATERERNYVLATGVVGATYYPVGTALARLVTVKLRPTQKIAMTPIGSAGSEENGRLLVENKAQFALLNGLVGYYTWIGQGPFAADGPQTDLRSVAALWKNVEHFIVKRQYAKTGTIEDMLGLQGKSVSLGLRSSGTLMSSRFLLGNLGIDIDKDLDLVYYSSFSQSAQALQKGEIEALSLEAGVPVTAITLAMTAVGHELVILDFTDAQVEKAQGGLNLWTRHVLKAGTYPAQDKDVNTIAIPTFLAVRAEVDEDAVYWITRTIYENLGFLQTVHKALSATSLDNALPGLPIPLHPGALRYYREAGLDIPAELIGE